MPFKQRLACWVAPLALALPLLTAACIPAPLPPPGYDIQEAAGYDWIIGGQGYTKPVNAWVRNRSLERFLKKAYTTGGVDSLKSKYGFECGSLAIVPPCDACQVCRMTLQMALDDREVKTDARYRVAPMIIQLWIGPDSESFGAMTYWERPPLANNQ
jgi:hypothetical protein